MKHATKSSGKYQDAKDRWAGLGPSYAMFPSIFADDVVAKYSRAGDTVLDPFAGRGTSLFSSIIAGRKALGMEVNPVGWIGAEGGVSASQNTTNKSTSYPYDTDSDSPIRLPAIREELQHMGHVFV